MEKLLFIKSTNTTTINFKHKYLALLALVFLFFVGLFVLFPRMSSDNGPLSFSASINSSQLPEPLKSVRVDLSAMALPADQTAWRQQIISQLTAASANTVFINPWSDGQANYQSQLAPLSPLGQQRWLEQFINEAHAANLQVYGWFVVGKDNFPSQLHPDWYARTITDQPYLQADEPGINLPFASLANQDFLRYHLATINEANQLPLDGWVISEPLIGWGDKDDSYYTDFSDAAVAFYRERGLAQPQQIISRLRSEDTSADPAAYQQFINARAGIVTKFVSQTVQTIRQQPGRSLIITVFTEPDAQGKLKSLDEIKEWLGTDIVAFTSLRPDIIEIQSLFLDFEYPQPPAWTASMIHQFRQQLPIPLPIAVSVQGFDSATPLAPDQFAAALSAALQQSVTGTSFYAYHTLRPEHWQQLTTLWKTN